MCLLCYAIEFVVIIGTLVIFMFTESRLAHLSYITVQICLRQIFEKIV